MPRPENPIDTPVTALFTFAAGLRELRAAAGGISYQRLAAIAHYSAASLSRAASGRRLPPWPVVRAYVLACHGNEAEWRGRWEAASTAVGASPLMAVPSSGGR